ncbi:MAG TPA: MarR family transcriptional regulator [Chloroflexota bacterium]|nr:MarR family transcriptional regulator [Chloroflexota bacterium]
MAELGDGAGGGAGKEGEHDEQQVGRFVERLALNLSESGWPRMAARVFAGLLVAADGRRTAAQLVELLHVSPAAISGAVRYLMQVGLITREREPGQRRDYYRVYDDLWTCGTRPSCARISACCAWKPACKTASRSSAPAPPQGGDSTRRAASSSSCVASCPT